MKKLPCLLTILLLVFIRSNAQTDTVVKSQGELLDYFGIGFPDFRNLNTVLKANNYPEIGSGNYTSGISLLRISRHFVRGGEVTFNQALKHKDSFSSSVAGLGVNVSFGYPYLRKKKIEMYSFIDIGVYETTIKVTKDIPGNTTFSSYASSNRNQLEMNAYTPSLNFVTVFNYLFKFSKNEKYKELGLLGIKAGYQFFTWNLDWSMSKNTSLKDGPSINPLGYYAMGIFGVEF